MKAPYRIIVNRYGECRYTYGTFTSIRAAEQQTMWHRANVGRDKQVIIDGSRTPVRLHDSNRVVKIDGTHTLAQRYVQKADELDLPSEVQVLMPDGMTYTANVSEPDMTRRFPVISLSYHGVRVRSEVARLTVIDAAREGKPVRW